MVKTDQPDRILFSSASPQTVLQKSAWGVLCLILGGFLIWYVRGPAGTDHPTPPEGLPIYANAEMAQTNALGIKTQAPDYRKYADLKVPPLPPEKALKTFDLEEGFRIEIVAHEPEVVDPVAMDVDPNGRLWVVEMQSYMPVYDKGEKETSELERVPKSRIVVLEDTTGDGRMDHNWVFMDDLVLPRSIKVLDDGVLIGEPPRVWFIQDTTGDGVGDTREVVYEKYGDPDSDNVEHMTNGLMWGIDNWIYSVYSDISLRRVDGRWRTRPFEQITQWGITQDDWGRLYSSHNSRMLMTHLSPYGYNQRNPDFSLEEGIDKSIAESETVWPAHPTGVNRGYRVGEVIRKDGTLKRSTATCGPVIYRGDQFGEEYRGNAFVPEPAGNLIKRLTGMDEEPGKIEAEARFAYEGREFLTSTDERFRPVNMYNAPDGSVYVLDMYRGIFQHARYLTDYLRNYAIEHDLHKPAGESRFGRIYRIVREDREIDYNVPRLLEKDPGELVGYLTHENGMLRDAAQQLLVQRSPAEVVPTLESFVRDRSVKFYTRLQALWTLEGFEENRFSPARLSAIAQRALADPHPRVRAAAIRILEPEIRRDSENVLGRLERLAGEESAPYPLVQLLASLGESNDPTALYAMAGILNDNPDNPYFREMALTGVYQREAQLLAILQKEYDWRKGDFDGQDWVMERLVKAGGKTRDRKPQLTGPAQKLYELGAQQFRACMACHGTQGKGMDGVAPPLDGSPWVNGGPKPLVRILLQGLQGGVDDKGNEIAGVMPSHRYLSDKEAAAVLTYIRQSWSNRATPVTAEEVAAVRKATEGRQEEWTHEELRRLSD